MRRLVSDAGGWAVPIAVRRPMGDWRFRRGRAADGRRRRVLGRAPRHRHRREHARRGAAGGPADRLSRARATPSTTRPGSREIELVAARSVQAAANAVAAPRAPLVTLGLLGDGRRTARLQAVLRGVQRGRRRPRPPTPTPSRTRSRARRRSDAIGCLIGLAILALAVVVLVVLTAVLVAGGGRSPLRLDRRGGRGRLAERRAGVAASTMRRSRSYTRRPIGPARRRADLDRSSTPPRPPADTGDAS